MCGRNDSAHLLRRALAADDRTGDRSGLLAVRRFAGEEERRLQRLCKLFLRVDAAHAGVRIRAAAERIVLPVMGERADEKTIDRAAPRAEDAGHRIECAIDRIALRGEYIGRVSGAPPG